MIVRILGLGVFRLAESDIPAIEAVDDALEAAIALGDQIAFTRALGDLTDAVVSLGDPVPAQELVTSDVVLPPGDTTLAEAIAFGIDEDGAIPG